MACGQLIDYGSDQHTALPTSTSQVRCCLTATANIATDNLQDNTVVAASHNGSGHSAQIADVTDNATDIDIELLDKAVVASIRQRSLFEGLINPDASEHRWWTTSLGSTHGCRRQTMRWQLSSGGPGRGRDHLTSCRRLSKTRRTGRRPIRPWCLPTSLTLLHRRESRIWHQDHCSQRRTYPRSNGAQITVD